MNTHSKGSDARPEEGDPSLCQKLKSWVLISLASNRRNSQNKFSLQRAECQYLWVLTRMQSRDSDDGRRDLAGRSSRQVCWAEWFTESDSARRSHWQEVRDPRILDVLGRVSPQNSSGTD